jgi:peptidoglycan/xylan/chitin deacetylase (PgdA/CDA1 family)
MDVEDWYHLDYFRRSDCNEAISLLDGLDRYLDILSEENIPSSFFVLGELATRVAHRIAYHPDIGIHGWSHRRPLTMSVAEFQNDIKRTKSALEDTLGREISGHRAPCFSLDRERLDVLQDMGFVYDSSRIQFGNHPLYGTINMSAFESLRPWIFQRNGFFEFELSTLEVFSRPIPVSGGGYLRLLPWPIMHVMLRKYLKTESMFVLYIHPFELSGKADPPLPVGTTWPTRLRFSRGRSTLECRLRQVIALLRAYGFTFSTFSQVRQDILATGGLKKGT